MCPPVPRILILKISLLTESSASATQSLVKYNEVDAVGKSAKKLSKS